LDTVDTGIQCSAPVHYWQTTNNDEKKF
jgi:hypothetical protein